LGFNIVDQGRYGMTCSPRLTDIVNPELYAKLQSIGLALNDALHVMYAHQNGCDYFVTVDIRDILPHRSEIEIASGRMRIVTPSELIDALGTSESEPT